MDKITDVDAFRLESKEYEELPYVLVPGSIPPERWEKILKKSEEMREAMLRGERPQLNLLSTGVAGPLYGGWPIPRPELSVPERTGHGGHTGNKRENRQDRKGSEAQTAQMQGEEYHTDHVLADTESQQYEWKRVVEEKKVRKFGVKTKVSAPVVSSEPGLHGPKIHVESEVSRRSAFTSVHAYTGNSRRIDNTPSNRNARDTAAQVSTSSANPNPFNVSQALNALTNIQDKYKSFKTVQIPSHPSDSSSSSAARVLNINHRISNVQEPAYHRPNQSYQHVNEDYSTKPKPDQPIRPGQSPQPAQFAHPMDEEEDELLSTTQELDGSQNTEVSISTTHYLYGSQSQNTTTFTNITNPISKTDSASSYLRELERGSGFGVSGTYGDNIENVNPTRSNQGSYNRPSRNRDHTPHSVSTWNFASDDAFSSQPVRGISTFVGDDIGDAYQDDPYATGTGYLPGYNVSYADPYDD